MGSRVLEATPGFSTRAGAAEITVDPDGNLWFVQPIETAPVGTTTVEITPAFTG